MPRYHHFISDINGKKFTNKRNLTSELTAKYLHCDLCEYKSRYITHLQSHSSTVHLSVKKTCHLCGKELKSEISLKDHLRSVHEKKYKKLMMKAQQK